MRDKSAAKRDHVADDGGFPDLYVCSFCDYAHEDYDDFDEHLCPYGQQWRKR